MELNPPDTHFTFDCHNSNARLINNIFDAFSFLAFPQHVTLGFLIAMFVISINEAPWTGIQISGDNNQQNTNNFERQFMNAKQFIMISEKRLDRR